VQRYVRPYTFGSTTAHSRMGSGVRRVYERSLPQLFRVLLAVIVLGALVTFPVPSTAAELPPIPDVSAKAVYSIDIDADVELYAQNEDSPLEPASTTKIATALLFVRNVEDLDQTVTIEPGDVSGDGESNMGLQAGDIVTFRDLLYGLLLPSGNDAANAVARVIGGQLLAAKGKTGDPVQRFIDEMNALATELKLEHTHFLNATGLHQDGHVTSARDLATLARMTFTQRTIRDVIKEPSYVFTYQGPHQREATIETSVLMKKEGVDGVVGGKTGTTTEAGACLVLETQERGGNRVITVLLGSSIEFTPEGDRLDETDRRYDDMRAILAKMDEDYQWVDISKDKDVPGLQAEMSVWQVALENDYSIVVRRQDGAAISYLLQLGPEAEPNTEVGRVLFFVDAEQVAERPVVQLPPGGQAALFSPAA
jgi:D-alanyl-D-alanine carboxypeptidase (penicillin-binding protein 5/6)